MPRVTSPEQAARTFAALQEKVKQRTKLVNRYWRADDPSYDDKVSLLNSTGEWSK